MTNEVSINLNASLKTLDETYFGDDKGKITLTDALYFAVSKNIRKLGAVVKEKEELQKDINKRWQKEFEFDDEKYNSDKDYKKLADDAYTEYYKGEGVQSELNDFLKKESNIEIHKVAEAEIENSKIPVVFKEFLVEFLT
jgi:hypothetical protein